MIKRIALLLVAGLISTALCACSGQPSPDEDTPAEQQTAEDAASDEIVGMANPITEYG